jgi:flagellar biosynthesis protein FliP
LLTLDQCELKSKQKDPLDQGHNVSELEGEEEALSVPELVTVDVLAFRREIIEEYMACLRILVRVSLARSSFGVCEMNSNLLFVFLAMVDYFLV